jgi:hypothetical protein
MSESVESNLQAAANDTFFGICGKERHISTLTVKEILASNYRYFVQRKRRHNLK